MSHGELLARAAVPMLKIIRDIQPDQLTARTPCTEFDVRALVNHLLFWGPSLEAAARKEAVPPPAESESNVDLAAGDWAGALEAHVNRTVAAWRPAQAWLGDTKMGGPMELAADLVGGMIVGEFLIHGWDLARATGQHLEPDEDIADYLYGEVARSAEWGRQVGSYGPELTLQATAPTWDRTLALTGRDPGWRRS